MKWFNLKLKLELSRRSYRVCVYSVITKQASVLSLSAATGQSESESSVRRRLIRQRERVWFGVCDWRIINQSRPTASVQAQIHWVCAQQEKTIRSIMVFRGRPTQNGNFFHLKKNKVMTGAAEVSMEVFFVFVLWSELGLTANTLV